MKKPLHYHHDFKEFFTLFDKATELNNIVEMKKLIKQIKENEYLFLEGYQKKKKEGAYYTNKDISKFIIQECLIAKINQAVNNKAEKLNKIKKIEDIFGLSSNEQDIIYNLLLNTSICDPACGSGVFLLNAAEEIFDILIRIKEDIAHNTIKEKITKNLFGVDINEYAVKLSILKVFAWILTNTTLDYSRKLINITSNFKILNSLFAGNWGDHLFNTPKFDILVGNPPYGNILNKTEKELLKSEDIFYTDAYCAFILKSIQWSDGIIGLLIPKSFLLRQGYRDFREKLFSRLHILKIYDLGSKIFKGATNEVQIVLFNKKNSHINNGQTPDLVVFDYPDKKIITYANQQVDNLRICVNKFCPLFVNVKKAYVYTFETKCPYCNSETAELLRIRIKASKEILNLITKIEKIGDLNYLNMIDFPKMIRGEEDKGLSKIKAKLKTNLNGSCYFISARNDFNYYYYRKKKSFNIEEIDSKLLKGNNFEYYKNPKLLLKHNNIIPQALFSEDNICFTSSIYSILHEDNDELKYLCAIFNSAIIQFYCTYAINNQKDTTINLNQYMIRHIPIIKAGNNIKSAVIERVDRITSLYKDTKGKITDNIRILTKELDNILFGLYKLTESEQNLVLVKNKENIPYFQNIY